MERVWSPTVKSVVALSSMCKPDPAEGEGGLGLDGREGAEVEKPSAPPRRTEDF